MFKRTAKQTQLAQLIKYKKFILAFGGSSSGKTLYFLRSLLIRAIKAQNSNHLILRQSFNSAKRTIGLRTLPVAFASLGLRNGIDYSHNKSDWYFKLSNDSTVWLCGVDSEVSLDKILGDRCSTVFIDEGTQLSHNAYETILTRLGDKSVLQNKVFIACNPTSKKHWIYRRWFGDLYDENTHASLLMNPIDNLENIADDYIEGVLKTLSKPKQLRFLKGMFVDDVAGALWSVDLIENSTVDYATLEELQKEVEIIQIVIGVDPAISHKKDSDLTGIVVAGRGIDGNFYILEDQSLIARPETWAQVVLNLYQKYNANSVIVEVNQGGDMVPATLRNGGFLGDIKTVHASKGKFARADPISALYGQGKVFHLRTPQLSKLEDEMTDYVPLSSSKSPDRLDAMVWAVTYLSEGPGEYFCTVY